MWMQIGIIIIFVSKMCLERQHPYILQEDIVFQLRNFAQCVWIDTSHSLKFSILKTYIPTIVGLLCLERHYTDILKV